MPTVGCHRRYFVEIPSAYSAYISLDISAGDFAAVGFYLLTNFGARQQTYPLVKGSILDREK